MKTMRAETLYQLMFDKLRQIGLTEIDAQTTAVCLLDTSLYGVDTHGIRLFRYYVEEWQNGRAKIHPDIHFESSAPLGGLLDADSANGIVAGSAAMKLVLDKTKDFGMSCVVVKNSNHYGAASNFSRMAPAQDCIGISMSNSDALVALQGGNEAFLGTNPIAVSLPGENGEVFNLDFATSQVSYSKVMTFLARGADLEPGWAIARDGQDSAVDNCFNALKPLGGYKGQGLAMMVQMLTCVLAGMPFDHQLSHFYDAPFDSPRQISHFFMAINPQMFMDTTTFRQRVSALMKEAKDHTCEVIVPGQKESQARIEREQHGIPLSDEDHDYFSQLLKLQA